ncbi:MAG: VCBS repeat-containing protein [Gemmatimonadaceae bacterium]|nr:VCBS repeat-containing protein [Gemmatimonadaceae bacterium]
MIHPASLRLRRLVPTLGLAAAAGSVSMLACSGERNGGEVIQAGEVPKVGATLFTQLPSSLTGVQFANRLTDSKALNVFTYRNYYNGGGVAIGDLSGDGRPEIVLTSNTGGPRVYLNAGSFRFREITDDAGLESPRDAWTTGVTLADVNGDGRLDMYVCRAGAGAPATRANALWINQGTDADGVPTFKEMAAQYGVADEGYSTQAAFLDYDRDGDLDLFVVNNSPQPASSFGMRNMRHVRDRFGGAKLFRHDGERFTDVSEAAGIHSPEVAFGLGIAVADVNRDGWPDVYVSNDFFERDYLYVNKGDGTFSETLDQQMPVVSYFSMGLDVADLDNDLWPDVYTTDMLPDDDVRLKTTSMSEGWDVYRARIRNGYHHQFMRNMLQRNNRDGTFSDVGQMAGVSRTDWSWSALIADLDLDGLKDIFVTNGLAKDVTSQDYVAFLANEETMKAATNGGKSRVDFQQLVKAMTSTPLSNYAFRNAGDLRFVNEAAAWGLDMPSFSNGAAYGDLDGDGAPDLVVNNVDQEAFVYRNNARTLRPANHFLRVKLEGVGGNRLGVGARVTAWAGDAAFMLEQAPTRGFQSSMDPVLDFGLGPRATVDTLRVDWPDGRTSVMRQVGTNQLVTVRQGDAAAGAPQPAAPWRIPARAGAPLTDISAQSTLDVVHRENDFVDFDRERLIPKLVSTEGPAMAVGDVNGDKLDDVYLGGAKDQAGTLLIQQRGGRFTRSDEALFARDAISEDVGATFLDADGDGDMDLYVVSGGNEFSEGAPALQDRLYLNDGRGRFRKSVGQLPEESASGSRVVAADYDGDGAMDLFVGGRVVPWQYGIAPRSMLLRNDGRGRFTDVTAKAAPGLDHIGMVTDAVWRDVDRDGRQDLIVVGEWMPITIFRNAGGGRLERITVRGLEKSDGWWNRIVAGDFNGDGRVDFVVGNLGLNGRMQASEREPVTMYVKDFDANGSVEQVISRFQNGVDSPLPLRDDLIRTLPYLKARYLNYKDYARQSVRDIFSARELGDAVLRQAHTFATSMARNNGDGSFTLVPLPSKAQLAPVYGILASDVDHDGHTDLLLAGNFDGFKPELGRMSSSAGLLLRGDGKGAFTPVRAPESGFTVPGQARDIQRVRTSDGALIVVARNNDRPLVFRTASAVRIARAR